MSSRGPPAWSSCWVFFVCILLLSCLRAICPATPPCSRYTCLVMSLFIPRISFPCAPCPPVAHVRTSSGRCGWGRRWREVSLVLVCWCRWGSRRGGGRSPGSASSLLLRPDIGAAATSSLLTWCLRLSSSPRVKLSRRRDWR